MVENSLLAKFEKKSIRAKNIIRLKSSVFDLTIDSTFQCTLYFFMTMLFTLIIKMMHVSLARMCQVFTL